MAQTASIRATLLRNLFTRPRPISPKQFALSRSHVFPGEADFLNFLRAEGTHEMIENAKTVLYHLIYHHHFSVPTRLISNLLLSQEQDPAKALTVRAGEYIAQDHFVHLVHLYLLGVYLFAHHRGIHGSMIAYLNNTRRSLKSKFSLHTAGGSNYELFGTLWAHFVLFHDVGYPLERVEPLLRHEELKARDSVLKPFTRIVKSVVKDLSLKALARMVVLHLGIPANSQQTLANMYLDHAESVYRDDFLAVKNAKSDDPLPFRQVPTASSSAAGRYHPDFAGPAEAIHLPLISGPDSLHVLRSVFSDEHLYAVLEDAATGQPIVLMRCQRQLAASNAVPLTIWFATRRERPKKVMASRHDLRRMAFDVCAVPDSRFVWRYFAESPRRRLDDELTRLFSTHLADFRKVAGQIEGDESVRAALVGARNQTADLGYLAFRRLSQYLGYDSEADTAQPELDDVLTDINKGFRNVERDLTVTVSRCVEGLLKQAVSQGQLRIGKLMEESASLDELAEAVVTFVLGQRTALKTRVRQEVLPQITQGAELQRAAHSCVVHLRHRLQEATGEPGDNVDVFRRLPLDHKSGLANYLAGLAPFTEKVDGRMQQAGLPSLRRFAAGYAASWTKELNHAKSAMDHGLVGAVVLTSVVRSCLPTVARLQSEGGLGVPADVTLARLAFASGSHEEDRWLEAEAECLLSEVAFAISLHNINPADFIDAKFRTHRTDMLNEPFVFLALLTDGLQRWDRDRAASHAKNDVQGYTAGSSFGIEVDGDIICISLTGARLDMRREEQALRGSLKAYLKDAHSMIRLNLAESQR